jgi:hypothetical protein
LAENAKKYRLSLHRAIKRYLRYHGGGRIETAIDPNFPESIDWAERLGFQREGLMAHWTPDGSDWLLYARVDRHGTYRDFGSDRSRLRNRSNGSGARSSTVV